MQLVAAHVPAGAVHWPKPFTMVSRYIRAVEIGRRGAVRVAERIDIEHAAVARAGFLRDLACGFVADRALAEDDRNLVLAHAVDDLLHLLRRALLVGVHRPEEQLLHAEVAREIGERAFARDQPALVFRNLGELLAQRLVDRLELRGVGRGVGVVGLRVRRIDASPAPCGCSPRRSPRFAATSTRADSACRCTVLRRFRSARCPR